MINASSQLQIRSGLNFLGTAASADRNGAAFDSAGFEGVLMVFKFSAIGADAVTTIKAQQDTDSGMGTAADLAGTGQTVAVDDDDQIFVIDLVRPRERYVRGVVDKDAGGATHVSDECLMYIGYGARTEPVTLTLADKVTYEKHVSPAEGTA